MTITGWAHLPNAKHIDRVLAHVRAHPDKWSAERNEAWAIARDAAMFAIQGAHRGAAMNAAWDAVLQDDRDGMLNEAQDAALDAAWDALYALIAWDDAADLLTTPVDATRLLASCGRHPALLILPACIAFDATV